MEIRSTSYELHVEASQADTFLDAFSLAIRSPFFMENLSVYIKCVQLTTVRYTIYNIDNPHGNGIQDGIQIPMRLKQTKFCFLQIIWIQRSKLTICIL